MLDIGYSHSVSSVNDARIQKIDEAVGGILGTGTPGSMLVDFFPIRMYSALAIPFTVRLSCYTGGVVKHIPAWMPGAGWKRTAQRLRPAIDAMNLDPFREVVRDMVRTFHLDRAPRLNGGYP